MPAPPWKLRSAMAGKTARGIPKIIAIRSIMNIDDRTGFLTAKASPSLTERKFACGSPSPSGIIGGTHFSEINPAM